MAAYGAMEFNDPEEILGDLPSHDTVIEMMI
jgi:hypothetical protein